MIILKWFSDNGSISNSASRDIVNEENNDIIQHSDFMKSAKDFQSSILKVLYSSQYNFMTLRFS